MYDEDGKEAHMPGAHYRDGEVRVGTLTTSSIWSDTADVHCVGRPGYYIVVLTSTCHILYKRVGNLVPLLNFHITLARGRPNFRSSSEAWYSSFSDLTKI